MRKTLTVPSDEPSVRVLGPVQLLGAGGEGIELPSAAQRRLLGVLAVHASTAVRAEWLCGVLEVTGGALRTSVSRLRRLVGEEALQTTVGGYRLNAVIDARVACAELQSAHRDVAVISRALERWAGNALEEFADEAWAVAEAGRLGAVRAVAVEDLGEALIAVRRPDDALAVLGPHIVEHPLRDRPRGLIIRALAASGRQTEALRAFQRYRDELVEAAGTEPSAELRLLEQRVAAGWDGFDDRLRSRTGRPAEPAAHRAAPPLHEMLVATPSGIGRRSELAMLAGAAEQAGCDGVRTVLVTGGAGIGKTTLLATFAREASGWHVFYGRCDEHVVVPYHPFQGVVGRLVDTLESDVLMAHTSSWGGDLLRLLPHLAGRIACSVPVAGDDGTARHQMFNAVLDIIQRSAEVAPLILMLDDLHWAEPAALQLLRHLAHNLGPSPVLFVLCAREPAALMAVLDEASVVELRGFDVDELGAMVHAQLAGTTGRDVGAITARLYTETAGNPLFAEHLLRHWGETGQIGVDDEVASSALATALELPSGLRDLVWHRVAALGPEAQPVLSAAAVFGMQFNQRVLTSMTDLADHTVAALLDRAVAVGILADHPSLSGNVRFTHALVARALEAELGSRAAETLHARAFEAMLAAQVTPPVELAPQLARHAELGGLFGEAQRWATSAGELALSDLAPHEAVRWFRRAVDLASSRAAPDTEQADLLVRLGEAATRAGQPDALETIRQGAELARACGADATLIRAALATTRGSLRSLWSGEQLAIVEAAYARSERSDLETRARL
ncbi:MAG: AAA family ATPase, partial [Ilumatobacteraceae bacterium]